MIISHRHRFIFFPDPLDGSPALSAGFAPFGDEYVQDARSRDTSAQYYIGMSPQEVEWAFDASGLAFQSYYRIAVVQNPFMRMARLYQRIAQTDPFWLARERAGFGRRDFTSWLAKVRNCGVGAGGINSPRWRRFGAWSAEHWCGTQVSHVVRQEHIEADLTVVLGALGVAPGFDADFDMPSQITDWAAYYTPRAQEIIRNRYRWDLLKYGYGTADLRAAS